MHGGSAPSLLCASSSASSRVSCKRPLQHTPRQQHAACSTACLLPHTGFRPASREQQQACATEVVTASGVGRRAEAMRQGGAAARCRWSRAGCGARCARRRAGAARQRSRGASARRCATSRGASPTGERARVRACVCCKTSVTLQCKGAAQCMRRYTAHEKAWAL